MRQFYSLISFVNLSYNVAKFVYVLHNTHLDTSHTHLDGFVNLPPLWAKWSDSSRSEGYLLIHIDARVQIMNSLVELTKTCAWKSLTQQQILYTENAACMIFWMSWSSDDKVHAQFVFYLTILTGRWSKVFPRWLSFTYSWIVLPNALSLPSDKKGQESV